MQACNYCAREKYGEFRWMYVTYEVTHYIDLTVGDFHKAN
jgi:hypothetical protein